MQFWSSRKCRFLAIFMVSNSNQYVNQLLLSRFVVASIFLVSGKFSLFIHNINVNLYYLGNLRIL